MQLKRPATDFEFICELGSSSSSRDEDSCVKFKRSWKNVFAANAFHFNCRDRSGSSWEKKRRSLSNSFVTLREREENSALY